MESILEVKGDGELVVPSGALKEMGWDPGDKVLLRRTEDSFNLTRLAMSAGAGAEEVRETVEDLRRRTVAPEKGTGELHEIVTEEP